MFALSIPWVAAFDMVERASQELDELDSMLTTLAQPPKTPDDDEASNPEEPETVAAAAEEEVTPPWRLVDRRQSLAPPKGFDANPPRVGMPKPLNDSCSFPVVRPRHDAAVAGGNVYKRAKTSGEEMRPRPPPGPPPVKATTSKSSKSAASASGKTQIVLPGKPPKAGNASQVGKAAHGANVATVVDPSVAQQRQKPPPPPPFMTAGSGNAAARAPRQQPLPPPPFMEAGNGGKAEAPPPPPPPPPPPGPPAAQAPPGYMMMMVHVPVPIMQPPPPKAKGGGLPGRSCGFRQRWFRARAMAERKGSVYLSHWLFLNPRPPDEQAMASWVEDTSNI